MKSCKNCRFSIKSKDLSSGYRYCKINDEKKLAIDVCDKYRRKRFLLWLYDYIIFLLNLI